MNNLTLCQMEYEDWRPKQRIFTDAEKAYWSGMRAMNAEEIGRIYGVGLGAMTAQERKDFQFMPRVSTSLLEALLGGSGSSGPGGLR